MPLVPRSLSDEVLQLRALSPTYLTEALAAVRESHRELENWLWWAQEPFDEKRYGEFIDRHAENFIRDREWRYFVFEQTSGILVGGASIKRSEFDGVKSANVGYWIRSTKTGLGFATRVVRILIEAVFEHMSDVVLIEIGMDVANIASARIPSKLGFTCQGEFAKPIRATAHTGRGLVWTLSRVQLATQLKERDDHASDG